MSTAAKKKRSRKNQRKNQNQSIGNIAGKGGYYTDKVLPVLQKVFPKGTFEAAGGSIGKNLGDIAHPCAGNLGKGVGSFLGRQLANIVGFGKYTVQQNSLITAGGPIPKGTEVPAFVSKGHKTTIRHREYLGDIVCPATPAAFTLINYRINAGDPTTFPWLSSIAANFQQYRFNGLVFEFKSMSSDITAGGSLGSVILATNYDTAAIVFSSKTTMENSEYCVSAKPSSSQIHCVECDPSLTPTKYFYVRDSSKGSATTDNRLYDLGNFQVATQGLPTSPGIVIGELWASYDVTLLKPDISDALNNGMASIFTNSGSGLYPFTSGTTYGLSIISITANTIAFLYPGQYFVTFFFQGTTLSNINMAITSGTGSVPQYHKTTDSALLGLAASYEVTALTVPLVCQVGLTAASVTQSIANICYFGPAYSVLGGIV
jgi:hypothetical protein